MMEMETAQRAKVSFPPADLQQQSGQSWQFHSLTTKISVSFKCKPEADKCFCQFLLGYKRSLVLFETKFRFSKDSR